MYIKYEIIFQTLNEKILYSRETKNKKKVFQL